MTVVVGGIYGGRRGHGRGHGRGGGRGHGRQLEFAGRWPSRCLKTHVAVCSLESCEQGRLLRIPTVSLAMTSRDGDWREWRIMPARRVLATGATRHQVLCANDEKTQIQRHAPNRTQPLRTRMATTSLDITATTQHSHYSHHSRRPPRQRSQAISTSYVVCSCIIHSAPSCASCDSRPSQPPPLSRCNAMTAQPPRAVAFTFLQDPAWRRSGSFGHRLTASPTPLGNCSSARTLLGGETTAHMA